MLIDSMPPATTRCASPSAIDLVPKMSACMPEPHTLPTVTAGTVSGMPALIIACRAGAWPMPAESTLPMYTSSIWSALSLARESAPLIAVEPSSGAVTPARTPR